MSRTPYRVLVQLHLAQDVLRAYRPWSVALYQVPKVSDGIHHVWSAVASRQKGAVGGGSTVNRVVVNSWIVLPKGTLALGESGVETVW
jgi:hypothetical protein